MKKINESPFKLVGFTYSEYQEWCKKHNKKEKDNQSKKEFFKLIYDFKLIKKDGQMVEVKEGE